MIVRLGASISSEGFIKPETRMDSTTDYTAPLQDLFGFCVTLLPVFKLVRDVLVREHHYSVK